MFSYQILKINKMNVLKNKETFIITNNSFSGLNPGDMLVCLEVLSDGDFIVDDLHYKILEKHLI